jgi:hypothetical protein
MPNTKENAEDARLERLMKTVAEGERQLKKEFALLITKAYLKTPDARLEVFESSKDLHGLYLCYVDHQSVVIKTKEWLDSCDRGESEFVLSPFFEDWVGGSGNVEGELNTKDVWEFVSSLDKTDVWNAQIYLPTDPSIFRLEGSAVFEGEVRVCAASRFWEDLRRIMRGKTMNKKDFEEGCKQLGVPSFNEMKEEIENEWLMSGVRQPKVRKKTRRAAL